METFKKFAKEFRSKIDKAIENGNVFKAGKIEADITVGIVAIKDVCQLERQILVTTFFCETTKDGSTI